MPTYRTKYAGIEVEYDGMWYYIMVGGEDHGRFEQYPTDAEIDAVDERRAGR